jgi:hypothetical protein
MAEENAGTNDAAAGNEGSDYIKLKVVGQVSRLWRQPGVA